jgi:hypothetical protein
MMGESTRSPKMEHKLTNRRLQESALDFGAFAIMLGTALWRSVSVGLQIISSSIVHAYLMR